MLVKAGWNKRVSGDNQGNTSSYIPSSTKMKELFLDRFFHLRYLEGLLIAFELRMSKDGITCRTVVTREMYPPDINRKWTDISEN